MIHAIKILYPNNQTIRFLAGQDRIQKEKSIQAKGNRDSDIGVDQNTKTERLEMTAEIKCDPNAFKDKEGQMISIGKSTYIIVEVREKSIVIKPDGGIKG